MRQRELPVAAKRLVLLTAGLLSLAVPCPAWAQDCPEGPSELEQDIEGPFPGLPHLFGWDVALDGSTLAVGLPGAGDTRGLVSVYELRAGTWEWEASLEASSALPDGHNLALRVGLHGDVLAASITRLDPTMSGLDVGAVAVFERSGGTWELVTIIEGSSGEREPFFGQDLDVHGDTILIGSPGQSTPGARLSGAVEVHVRGPGGWELQQRIEEPAESDEGSFGGSVALWEDLAAVGVGENARGFSHVAAVLRRTAGTWEREAILGEPRERTGAWVAVHSERVLTGSADLARLYRHAGGGAWEIEQDLVPAAGSSLIRGVDLHPPNAIISPTPPGVGSAPNLVVFRLDGADWTERATLSSDPDTFSIGTRQPVALDGDRAVLGAPFGERPTRLLEGTVYVFACGDNSPPSCDAGIDLITPCDGVALSATADDPEGQELTVAWTSSCPGTSFAPGPDALDPFVTFGDSCGLECELRLTVDDGNGGTCSDTLLVLVDDLTPPELSGVPADVTVGCDDVPSVATVTAFDSCDPAPRLDVEERRIDGSCPHSYALLRTWTATDICGHATSATRRIDVVDDEPPLLSGIPAGARVDCAAVPPPVEPTVEDDCDPAPSLEFAEVRIDGACPGSYDLLRQWTATDACGNFAVAERVVEVRDTTPPSITPSDAVEHCLWPPAHGMRSFDLDQFAPELSDDCSPPTSWRFVGCLSDQADDGLGDGHTTIDCTVEPSGERLWVRLERSGRIAAGRFIDVLATAVDACGNWSEPVRIGRVHVPHDAARHEACESDP